MTTLTTFLILNTLAITKQKDNRLTNGTASNKFDEALSKLSDLNRHISALNSRIIEANSDESDTTTVYATPLEQNDDVAQLQDVSGINSQTSEESEPTAHRCNKCRAAISNRENAHLKSDPKMIEINNKFDAMIDPTCQK